jgi:hypothetical protein
MKKIILFAFTLSLLFSSCSKSSNDDSSGPKVYKVEFKASCLSNTVENVGSYDMYTEFDSPTFAPIANKWYKVEGGFFYYKITNITPVQDSRIVGHFVLVSQHYDAYCR